MAPDAAEELDEPQRARGRRLAIASHPFGMTFHMVFTNPLPTLALVSLGASETLVGLQTACVHGALVLQLLALRAVARLAKRTILLGGHALAVLAALPLLWFDRIAEQAASLGVWLTLGSFAVVAVGIAVSQTVWFPLLRSYVEPDRIGRFFGTIRTGWHLTLIAFFLASQAWLERHPGSFGPLFAAAWVCGLLRVVLIARLPERSERTGAPVRVREALGLLRDASMRRYLAGACAATGVRVATLPFVIVMLRREVGFSEAHVVLTTVATFAGGLASLYLWGWAVDRVGTGPIFRGTALGMAALVLALVGVSGSGTGTLVAMVGFFFAHSLLAAGWGVADTHLIFQLAPVHAPSRALVLGSVSVGAVAGLTPALAGVLIERGLLAAADPLGVYRIFFVVMGLLQALAFLPLRGLRPASG